jgi:hypothetical protein
MSFIPVSPVYTRFCYFSRLSRFLSFELVFLISTCFSRLYALLLFLVGTRLYPTLSFLFAPFVAEWLERLEANVRKHIEKQGEQHIFKTCQK